MWADCRRRASLDFLRPQACPGWESGTFGGTRALFRAISFFCARRFRAPFLFCQPTKKPFGIIWVDKKCIKKCEDTFDGVCQDSRGCDDDSRCFDGSECSTLAGEECDDWAGGESTETRGRCNGELDDADEDNKEDS